MSPADVARPLGLLSLAVAVSVVAAPIMKSTDGMHSNAKFYGVTLILGRALFCAVFPREECFKDIRVEGGQCVLIEFDTQGELLDFDCSVLQKNAKECPLASDAGTTAAAALTLVLSGMCLHFSSAGNFQMFLRLLVSSSAAFLWALGGEAGASAPDIQTEFARRRCRSNDIVSYVNHSEEAVYLRIRFSTTEFRLHLFSSTGILLKHTVLHDPQYRAAMANFERELSSAMQELLSDPSAACRHRPMKAPAYLNVLIGLAGFALAAFGIYMSHQYFFNPQQYLEIQARCDAFLPKNILKSFQIIGETFLNVMSSIGQFFGGCLKALCTGLWNCTANYRIAIWIRQRSELFLQKLQKFVVLLLQGLQNLKGVVLLNREKLEEKIIKNNFVIQRLRDLWNCLFKEDTLQNLNLKNLRESRASFVKDFFQIAQKEHFENAPEGRNWPLFLETTKNSCHTWERCLPGDLDVKKEEELFRNVEELWRIWCDKKGEPDAKSDWNKPMFLSMPRKLWSPQSNVPNLMTLIELNYSNLVLTKDEVCEFA